MKIRAFCLVIATGLLIPFAAFAKEKDQGNLQLADRVRIGSARLQPGNYKVEWKGSGQNVNVNFLQHRKVMATAEGKLIQLQKPSPYDAAVLHRNGQGKLKTLDEIDFDNRTEALRLEPMTPNTPGATQNR